MLGFLKKDLLIISKDIKIFLPIFIAMNIAMGLDFAKMVFLTAFYMVTILLTSFSYEESSGFYGYISSMKNGRKNLVNGKYLATILLSIISVLITIAMYFVASKFKELGNFNELIKLIGVSVFTAIAAISLILPIMFKFGVERGRLFMFALFFGGSFGLSWIFKNIKIQLPAFLLDNGEMVLIFISLLIFTISYFVSRLVVDKKDY